MHQVPQRNGWKYLWDFTLFICLPHIQTMNWNGSAKHRNCISVTPVFVLTFRCGWRQTLSVTVLQAVITTKIMWQWSLWKTTLTLNITYFRDSNAKEIDVFIEENNVIHPLEIKKSASPDRREVKKYSVIDKASMNHGNGGIICMCEEPIPIDKDNCFIPSNLIWITPIAKVYFQETKQSPKALLFVLVCPENDRKGINKMPKTNDFTVSKKIVIYLF